MPEQNDSTIHSLRQRAERALMDDRRGRDVIAMLESLVRDAAEGTPDALFAHRQLAELLLEDSPWRAALHLRQLIGHDAADDSVHALMGLCQAQLGNFRMAVTAYRRALAVAPRNPWYHHNLGHLLDVGLGDAGAALHHLQAAHDIETQEDEITASLAHCLASLGRLDEAQHMASSALSHAPRNPEHQALLDWVKQGAPASGGQRPTAEPSGNRGIRRRSEAPGDDNQVEDLLASHMGEAGFSRRQVERAQALWNDFSGLSELRVAKPAVLAAAVEYAIAKMDSLPGVTQAQLARRYGVAPGSISNRYGEIRNTLALVPRDPRYCV